MLAVLNDLLIRFNEWADHVGFDLFFILGVLILVITNLVSSVRFKNAIIKKTREEFIDLKRSRLNQLDESRERSRNELGNSLIQAFALKRGDIDLPDYEKEKLWGQLNAGLIGYATKAEKTFKFYLESPEIIKDKKAFTTLVLESIRLSASVLISVNENLLSVFNKDNQPYDLQLEYTDDMLEYVKNNGTREEVYELENELLPALKEFNFVTE